MVTMGHRTRNSISKNNQNFQEVLGLLSEINLMEKDLKGRL